MKIVILTQYYPPETGAPQNRLSDLAKRLIKCGHRVEVLTALPNYPENAVFSEYRGRENRTEICEGIRVSRVGIYVPRNKTFLKRNLHYLSFAWNAICNASKLVQDVDIVFMESPPLFVAFAGIYLAKKRQAKLVVNVSDLWPQSAVEMGMLQFPLAVWLAEKLEAWMYQSAELITGQTRGIVDSIGHRFPQKRVRLFPNGIDAKLYKALPDRQASRGKFGWESNLFVIGYAGVLGHAQRLDQILDAAVLLKELREIHFALIGDGPCREALMGRINRENIDNVKIYAKVKSEEMPGVYAGMDCGCVPLGKEKVFRGARPSKMFEMMAAGLPILLCAEGEAAEIVRAPLEGPAGFVVSPEDPKAIAETVRRMIAKKEDLVQMGVRGRNYVFEQFDRGKIALDLEKELIAVNSKRRV